jgi:pimeloyl-ACP methyl ester carboxylesterase
VPCVVYLHGNCSCRLEAIPLVDLILPLKMSVFTFDFAGCGNSDGEYVSLGWHERDDLEIVIDHLRKQGVSNIGLWGRSMGAVTALLYSERDLSLFGIVLDSPFSDLKLLVKDLARTQSNIPNFLISGALKFVKKSIKKRAGFDFTTVRPVAHVDHCFVPALFGVARDDELVNPQHNGELLYNLYAGEKTLVIFPGKHNDERP